MLLCAFPVLATVVITASVLSAPTKKRSQKPQKQVTELPAVISNVPRLRVSNVTVKNLGTPDAVAVVEILNTSHLAVMSLELSTRNKGNSGGITEDGLMDLDNPRVVIPPFGTITLEMSFSEMIADAPLAISAAEFSDGTAAGDKSSLRGMRAVRKHRQDLRAEKKRRDGEQ